MSIHASGGESACAFDPATHTHYALSEHTECHLRTLARALDGIAQLVDTPLEETGPHIQPAAISALFFVLSCHVEHLLAEAVICFPRRGEDA